MYGSVTAINRECVVWFIVGWFLWLGFDFDSLLFLVIVRLRFCEFVVRFCVQILWCQIVHEIVRPSNCVCRFCFIALGYRRKGNSMMKKKHLLTLKLWHGKWCNLRKIFLTWTKCFGPIKNDKNENSNKNKLKLSLTLTWSLFHHYYYF